MSPLGGDDTGRGVGSARRGERGAPALSILLPRHPGAVLSAGRSGAATLRRSGGQRCSEVQVNASGELAALLLAVESVDALWRSKVLALLSYREQLRRSTPPIPTPRSSPVFCSTPERAWEGGCEQLPGPAKPSRCQTSGIPPYARSHRAGTARLILNYSEGGLTREIKARVRGGNTSEGRGAAARTPRGSTPGRGGRRWLGGARGATPARAPRGRGGSEGAPLLPADFSLGSKQLESSRNHWGREEDVSRSWTSKNRSAP